MGGSGRLSDPAAKGVLKGGGAEAGPPARGSTSGRGRGSGGAAAAPASGRGRAPGTAGELAEGAYREGGYGGGGWAAVRAAHAAGAFRDAQAAAERAAHPMALRAFAAAARAFSDAGAWVLLCGYAVACHLCAAHPMALCAFFAACAFSDAGARVLLCGGRAGGGRCTGVWGGVAVRAWWCACSSSSRGAPHGAGGVRKVRAGGSGGACGRRFVRSKIEVHGYPCGCSCAPVHAAGAWCLGLEVGARVGDIVQNYTPA